MKHPARRVKAGHLPTGRGTRPSPRAPRPADCQTSDNQPGHCAGLFVLAPWRAGPGILGVLGVALTVEALPGAALGVKALPVLARPWRAN